MHPIACALYCRLQHRHSIYAPGVFTGYVASVIPGLAGAQLAALTQALERAADTLEVPVR